MNHIWAAGTVGGMYCVNCNDIFPGHAVCPGALITAQQYHNILNTGWDESLGYKIIVTEGPTPQCSCGSKKANGVKNYGPGHASYCDVAEGKDRA